MTSKEKAEDLVNKYTVATWIRMDEIKHLTTIPDAKKCALIAVNEILKDREEIDGMRVINDPYWLEVKQEIEKL
jgi:hypothetical protein